MKLIGRIFLWLFLLLLVEVLMPHLLLLPMALAFGWIRAIVRYVPNMIPHASTLLWILLVLLVLVAGTHWFCVWIFHSLRDVTARWRWRWTLALHGGLWCVLLAIMGLVGIVHQLAWLSQSNEPMFLADRRFLRERVTIMKTASDLKRYADSVNWNRALLQNDIQSRVVQGYKQTNFVWELIDPHILPEMAEKAGAIVMIPRNPATFQNYGFFIIYPDDTGANWQRPETLTNALALRVETPATNGKVRP